MKFWSITLAAASLIFLSSAAHVEREAAEPGKIAPSIELKNDAGSASLASMRGSYVIVNFWSSSDPQSRINNALYDRLVCEQKDFDIRQMAICVDANRETFGQLLKVDALDGANQFYYEDSRLGNLIAEYSLLGENKAFLIDPQGCIVAVDPSVSDVKKLVSNVGLKG